MSLRVVALKTSVRSTSLKESCVAINLVDLDLCIIALAVEEEQEVTNKTERKFWVHDLWKKRREFGEFETFCKNLNQYPDLYYDYYKMTYIQFETLVNILKPHLKRHETNFRIPVSVEERLSICLRFLTTAISFQALSHSYRMGHSTVHTIVHETCGAIWKYLQPHVMPKPTPQLWTRIEEEFRTIWNFPNCIGAIDGKHVNIRAPWNSGSLFYNYKKFFSTVLLAITDAKYRFIVVDIGSYGRNSDSGILSSSKLGRKFQNKTLGIPPNKCLPGTTEELPHVFVGDEGFPLSEHLMRPYPSNQLTGDNEKKKFNYRLSRARRIVESSFGILQQKFEVFQKRIRMQPRYVDIMILACTCLHNYIRNHEIENEFGDQLENVSAATNSILQIIDEQENDDLQNNNSGIIVRNKFKSFFYSPNGAITWQNERLDFVR